MNNLVKITLNIVFNSNEINLTHEVKQNQYIDNWRDITPMTHEFNLHISY